MQKSAQENLDCIKTKPSILSVLRMSAKETWLCWQLLNFVTVSWCRQRVHVVFGLILIKMIPIF